MQKLLRKWKTSLPHFEVGIRPKWIHTRYLLSRSLGWCRWAIWNVYWCRIKCIRFECALAGSLHLFRACFISRHVVQLADACVHWRVAERQRWFYMCAQKFFLDVMMINIFSFSIVVVVLLWCFFIIYYYYYSIIIINCTNNKSNLPV